MNNSNIIQKIVQTKTNTFITMAFYVGREIKFFSRSHQMHDAKFVIYGEKDLLKTFVGNYDAFHILTIEFRFLIESPPSLNVMHSLYSGI